MMLVEAPSWGLVLVFKKFYYQMLEVWLSFEILF